MVNGFGVNSQLNQFLREQFLASSTPGIQFEDEEPQSDGGLLALLSGTPAGASVAAANASAVPAAREQVLNNVLAQVQSRPAFTSLPSSTVPRRSNEGSFFDRVLSTGRQGSVAKAFGEGIFGRGRARRAVQAQELELAGARALVDQRRAEAEKDRAAARKPSAVTFQRQDGSFLQVPIADKATFDAAVADPTLTLVNQPPAQQPGTVLQFRNTDTGEFTQAQVNTPELQGLINAPNQVFTGAISVQESGGPGSATSDKKLIRETRAQAASTEAFGRQIDTFMEFLGTNPDANTLTARAAGIADAALMELRALARASGANIPSVNIADFEQAFADTGLAGASARTKSAILNLALAAAGASGLGSGRALTDKDIDRALRLIGGNINNPQIIGQVLADMFGRMKAGVEISARRQGVEIQPIPGLSFGRQKPPGEMTDEEILEALGR